MFGIELKTYAGDPDGQLNKVPINGEKISNTQVQKPWNQSIARVIKIIASLGLLICLYLVGQLFLPYSGGDGLGILYLLILTPFLLVPSLLLLLAGETLGKHNYQPKNDFVGYALLFVGGILFLQAAVPTLFGGKGVNNGLSDLFSFLFVILPMVFSLGSAITGIILITGRKADPNGTKTLSQLISANAQSIGSLIVKLGIFGLIFITLGGYLLVLFPSIFVSAYHELSNFSMFLVFLLTIFMGIKLLPREDSIRKQAGSALIAIGLISFLTNIVLAGGFVVLDSFILLGFGAYILGTMKSNPKPIQ